MNNQINLYSGAHKAQRAMFFKISKAAGTLDINNEEALSLLGSELVAFQESMLHHADLEETFIHPLLSERVPGGADKLNEDHRIMRQQFNDLIACFRATKKKPNDFEKQQDLALEFYLAWNRFLSFYVNHINYEEENVMPSLWRLCTNDELINIFKQFLAKQTPQQLMSNIRMMLPAMNPSERAAIFNQARANMPPEAFQGVLKLAESVLTQEDWSALKTTLKI